MTLELLKLISDINSINLWLEKTSGDILPGNAIGLLTTKSLIKEIRDTNKIEGIYSTRKEIQDMIINDPPKKYKRFWGLVNKYRNIVNDQSSIIDSCTKIRRLYDEILLQDVIEENPKDAPDGTIFRKDEVSIVSSTQNTIHKGITGELEII